MSCQNLLYKSFCARMHQTIPCCPEVSQDVPSGDFPLKDGASKTGLISQFFELKQIFLQKKMVTFHAQGFCMYPCIKPGDILYIEPQTAEQIRIGDVAVYKRSGCFFGHRVVERGNDHGSPYIVTRPDISKAGNDGPAFDQDILGIVSHINRKGRILDAANKESHLFVKISTGLLIKYHCFRQFLFVKLVDFTVFIQQFDGYGRMAKLLFPHAIEGMNLSVHVPLSLNVAGRFDRKVTPQELVGLTLERDKAELVTWKILLSNKHAISVASLSFTFRPDTCVFPGWWLSEANIMLRYRGTEVEEELFAQTSDQLKKMGISRVFVSAFKDAYIKKALFKNPVFQGIFYDRSDTKPL